MISAMTAHRQLRCIPWVVEAAIILICLITAVQISTEQGSIWACGPVAIIAVIEMMRIPLSGWATHFAQRFRKVTPGSPADTQLYTYFPDTDIVITADKALLEILEESRPCAPCPLPSGYFVPPVREGSKTLYSW